MRQPLAQANEEIALRLVQVANVFILKALICKAIDHQVIGLSMLWFSTVLTEAERRPYEPVIIFGSRGYTHGVYNQPKRTKRE